MYLPESNMSISWLLFAWDYHTFCYISSVITTYQMNLWYELQLDWCAKTYTHKAVILVSERGYTNMLSIVCLTQILWLWDTLWIEPVWHSKLWSHYLDTLHQCFLTVCLIIVSWWLVILGQVHFLSQGSCGLQGKVFTLISSWRPFQSLCVFVMCSNAQAVLPSSSRLLWWIGQWFILKGNFLFAVADLLSDGAHREWYSRLLPQSPFIYGALI